MFSNKILQFLFTLKLPFTLQNGVEVLDAHQRSDVQEACRAFYKKYYRDNNRRHALIGINPGRFGGGVTGIPFTDPLRLEKVCGIDNSFQKKQELSSVFIYDMLEAYGGAQLFYKYFYITAMSPLGFVKNGKNLNYYDDKALLKDIQPFIINCMQQQIGFGLNTDVCFCIGEGENLKHLQKLNNEYKWFNRIETLPHPRFVMQYRLKRKNEFIESYISKLKAVT
ncbi:uracil-DNA glycosylase family protein [Parafilimonas sp.]|uniref:uracil-DNA glycosylase family protein n=1 Tax=Parafilimonas sp. TaxID=1969739 RepID=UPI0039E21739